MKPKHYIQKFIKTADDLPKESGDYHVQFKNGNGTIWHFPFNGDIGYNVIKADWIREVDYYLQEVEQLELTDEMIEDWIELQATEQTANHHYKYRNDIIAKELLEAVSILKKYKFFKWALSLKS